MVARVAGRAAPGLDLGCLDSGRNGEDKSHNSNDGCHFFGGDFEALGLCNWTFEVCGDRLQAVE